MIFISSILGLGIFAYLIFKFWFFTPETDIFYLVRLFNAEYRVISIVGRKNDSAPLVPLIRPFESVKPFRFKFQKLVTKKEAEEKHWPITFKFPGDEKVIVERDEEVKGWLAVELHAVGIEFVTKNGTDISLGLECAYHPIDDDGAILMKKSVKNWSAFADSQVQNIIGAWGRSKEKDEDVLGITIDEILEGVAKDTLKLDTDANPGETVKAYLNEKFEKHGFMIVAMTLYKVVNGPQSQDVKDKREAIKKAELDFKKAEYDRKAEFEKGMAKVDLQRVSLNNKAAYIERVNKSKNETVLEATKNLSKLQTLVIGEKFDTSSFTGATVANQKEEK